MPLDAQHVTTLSNALGRGERAAADQLVPALYAELHALASSNLRGERPDHTLQATAIVHEVYLRMLDQRNLTAMGRQQFLALAAQVTRRVLVDHARARQALKRGQGQGRLTLHESAAIFEQGSLDVLAVDEALEELAALEPRHARLVELRFFAGLSNGEVADALGVSLSTVEKDWRFVRSWLRARFADGTPAD